MADMPGTTIERRHSTGALVSREDHVRSTHQSLSAAFRSAQQAKLTESERTELLGLLADVKKTIEACDTYVGVFGA